MSIATTFDGDVRINGGLNVSGSLTPGLARSNIVADTGIYVIPWTAMRIWDAVQTNLTTAGVSDDDLGLTAGVFGTGVWYVYAGDVKAVTKTRRLRFTMPLPAEYQAGLALSLRISAGLLTTIADTSCTVDCEAYKSNKDTLKTGSDICATNAQSMNSLTFADLTFTLTPTGLNPGDEIDVRLTIASVDSATATAVTPALGMVSLVCTIRG